MGAVLAETEEAASGRTQRRLTASSLTAVRRQGYSDGMRVLFSLPKSHNVPHSISPSDSTRVASTSGWRASPKTVQWSLSLSFSSGRTVTGQVQTRTPPGTTQVSVSPAATQILSARKMQKSWSSQSSPGSSATHPGRPGLGPVISPPKAKAGLTATRHTS
ncbi:hypothetical protein F5148DRAFT_1204555 [Russula earlei]|uniref:Uncharacterized protein n=1 Tax=Russula earlei TaxID=71964 RepID=A0ACC0U7H4_9AGAM|nr:hypothetical protein F5148DRAFT_1204555 [Russula earlei]